MTMGHFRVQIPMFVGRDGVYSNALSGTYRMRSLANTLEVLRSLIRSYDSVAPLKCCSITFTATQRRA